MFVVKENNHPHVPEINFGNNQNCLPGLKELWHIDAVNVISREGKPVVNETRSIPVIEFFISAIPRAQARARHAVRAGRAFAYKAASQVADERTLEAMLYKFKPPNPLAGAISLSIGAVMPIAASKSKKFKTLASEGLVFPVGKPDLDNVAKNILDCLVRLRFIEDDRFVVALKITKQFGGIPGYHILIEELNS